MRKLLPLLLGCTLFLSACGSPPPDRGPVLCVGVDGLEWSVLLPLLESGELPVMAALLEHGVGGYLATLQPTYSPVIWTSLATGKLPSKHGILHFAYPDPESGQHRLVTSRHRKTKALWNLLSDAERRIDVVGWWMTYPAEPIRGTMVAQTNTVAQLETDRHARWQGSLVPGLGGQVHPPERQGELLALATDTQDRLPALVRETFGERPEPSDGFTSYLWQESLWAFRADSVYLRIALQLLEEGAPELLLVYFGGTDVLSHRFWRYYRPEDFEDRPSENQIARFGSLIPDYYRWVDRALGRLLAASGEGATVFVVSDHGMHAHGEQSDFSSGRPEDPSSGHHRDAPPGVLIASGPGIRQTPLAEAALPVLGSVLDLAPTLLALFEIPLGRDFDGRVLESVLAPEFLREHPVRHVPTHDTREWLANRSEPRPEELDTEAEQERIEQLEALGYL